jgi:hypothetical protein
MQKVDLSQMNIERLAKNSARFEAIAKYELMSSEEKLAVASKIKLFGSPTSFDDVAKYADALIVAIHEVLADQIHAPAVMLELDPTHQDCCGQCAGNCPPEEGWGPSNNG